MQSQTTHVDRGRWSRLGAMRHLHCCIDTGRACLQVGCPSPRPPVHNPYYVVVPHHSNTNDEDRVITKHWQPLSHLISIFLGCQPCFDESAVVGRHLGLLPRLHCTKTCARGYTFSPTGVPKDDFIVLRPGKRWRQWCHGCCHH